MIDFPASPTVNQEFSAAGKTWVWSGTAWGLKPVTGGGPSSPHAGADWDIRLNPQSIDENLTVTAAWNGMSAGPVTVASGFTVDVASGSTWSII